MLSNNNYFILKFLFIEILVGVSVLTTVNAQDQTLRADMQRVPTTLDLNSLPTSAQDSTNNVDSVFENPNLVSYPFPAKGRDLPEGVYWRVTGHSNNSKKRDMSATRFAEGAGNWTRSHPASAGLTGDANSLIWNVPVYAPASGIVLGCWRVAKDGDDPAEAGCGNSPADPSVPCRRPGGGNMVRLWVPDQNRIFLLAHFMENSVPEHICPHGRTEIADTSDKSGAFGMIPELANFPWPEVEQGEFLGRVGNSGRSGNPHLHIDLRECNVPLVNHADDCSFIPMRFNKADIAKIPAGRDIREDEWVALNGFLPVTIPRRIVRPDRGIGGIVAQPMLSVTQGELPSLTISLDVANPASPVDAFDWEIENPVTDAVFDEAMRSTFQLQGKCPNGVESLEITTDQNSFTQGFPASTNSIELTEELVGFAREDVEQFCLNFAQGQSDSAICTQAPEQCQSHLSTEFIGGEDGADSFVKARMECQNGSVLEREIMPRLNLICGLVPFGHLH